jgi:hypothetical protein
MQSTRRMERENALYEQYTLLQLSFTEQFERYLRQAEGPAEVSTTEEQVVKTEENTR